MSDFPDGLVTVLRDFANDGFSSAGRSEAFAEAADQIERLEAIVRGLAASGAPYDHEFGDCALCDKLTADDPAEPADHHPDCPWRQARELIGDRE